MSQIAGKNPASKKYYFGVFTANKKVDVDYVTAKLLIRIKQSQQILLKLIKKH